MQGWILKHVREPDLYVSEGEGCVPVLQDFPFVYRFSSDAEYLKKRTQVVNDWKLVQVEITEKE
jgi:hypothetical protein